jgi:AcrR family transcriptional regulator
MTQGNEFTGISRKELRRQSQQQIKQQDILNVAEQIFGQKGYLKASVHEIAELAEFSLSALYRLFESKEALFEAVLARRGKEVLHGLYGILTSEGSPRQKLHRLVDYTISFYHEHPDWGRTYLSMVTTAVPHFELEREEEDYRPPDADAITAQVIREGQSSGEFVSGEPLALARMLTGMVVTYLATDPAIMGEKALVSESFPLQQFHEMIDRAFCRPLDAKQPGE